MKSRIKIFGTILCIMIFRRLEAQEKTEEKFRTSVQPYLRAQLWNTYSDGISSEDAETAARAAIYFRRVRAGMKGKLLPNITCDFELMMDYLAKPENLSTKGSAPPSVKVWHMYLTWKMNQSEWFNLTGGYFLPHVSREAATSLWTVSSLDKSEVSCYLRQFVIGQPNGMAPGFNLGGTGKTGSPTLLYNIAIVNRQDVVNIQTENWSPVILGHTMLTLGDPECKTYNYTISNNILRKQKSVSLGFGFSSQGKTDIYKSSSTWSADLMFYLGALKLNGEYDKLIRRNETIYNAECFLGRISYNQILKNGWILEPAFSIEQFNGDDNYQDGTFYDGTDRKIDLGINLISEAKKMRIGLHYVDQDGNGTKNKYISGNTHPGNYAVLALQFML